MRRLWAKFTSHWFVIAYHCARNGHEWRTNSLFSVEVTACAWCGKLRGLKRSDVVVVSEDQKVVRFRRVDHE